MEKISVKEQHKIIREIQSSIDDNFDKLMGCYESMIYKIIHKYCYEKQIKDEYFEDLMQEGYIALHKGAKVYDFDMEVKFSTFIFMIIRRRIRHSYYKQAKLRAQYSEYRRGFITECSTDYEYIHEMKTPHTIFMDNIENEKVIQAYMRLSDIEKKVLKSVLRKKSYKDISEETGLKTKQVDYKKTRAKRILIESVKKETA